MNGAELVFAIVVGLALLAMKSAALPISVKLAKAMVCLFTVGLDKQIRADRLADLDAYLHDVIDDLRGQGYRPAELAVHILWHRTIVGLGDEVIWRVSHSPLIVARLILGVMTVSGLLLFVSTGLSIVADFLLVNSNGRFVGAAIISGLAMVWAYGVFLVARGLVGLHSVLYGSGTRS